MICSRMKIEKEVHLRTYQFLSSTEKKKQKTKHATDIVPPYYIFSLNNNKISKNLNNLTVFKLNNSNKINFLKFNTEDQKWRLTFKSS